METQANTTSHATALLAQARMYLGAYIADPQYATMVEQLTAAASAVSLAGLGVAVASQASAGASAGVLSGALKLADYARTCAHFVKYGGADARVAAYSIAVLALITHGVLVLSTRAPRFAAPGDMHAKHQALCSAVRNVHTADDERAYNTAASRVVPHLYT